MRKQGLPLQRLMTHETLTNLAGELRYADISALYAAVGEGHVSAQHVVGRLVESMGGEEGASEDLAEATSPTRALRRRSGDPGVVVVGRADVWVKLARCCTPVPGDPIIGFVTRGSGVSVHRADCTNAESLLSQPDRLVEVEWAPSAASVFLVADAGRGAGPHPPALGRHPDPVRPPRQHPVRERARPRVTAWRCPGSPSRWATPAHLDHVIKAVRKIDGVFDVYRITGGKVAKPEPV